MALPWKTILTHVPWKDVIGNAPKIADGAKKMWQSMGRKGADDATGEGSNNPTIPADADFATRLDLLEGSNRQLLAQTRAASELIQALSEQNAQLVAQTETLRRHVRLQAWLMRTTALLAGLALLFVTQPKFLEFFA